MGDGSPSHPDPARGAAGSPGPVVPPERTAGDAVPSSVRKPWANPGRHHSMPVHQSPARPAGYRVGFPRGHEVTPQASDPTATVGKPVDNRAALWIPHDVMPAVRKSSPCDFGLSTAVVHRPASPRQGRTPVVHRIHSRYDEDDRKLISDPSKSPNPQPGDSVTGGRTSVVQAAATLTERVETGAGGLSRGSQPCDQLRTGKLGHRSSGFPISPCVGARRYDQATNVSRE